MKKLLFFHLFLSVFIFANAVFAGTIVVTTSDFESGNTAMYDTETDTFIPAALGQDDQDVVVDTDGEYVYFLSRSLGSVSKYTPGGIGTGISGDGMIWQYSVGPDSNPYDIVFLESKAYVIRCGSPEILIVDQNAENRESFELGTINISSYDVNGVPEAAHGFVFDNMVYVVLQRLNGGAAEVPGYLLKIDPATDTIVDLDPGTDGVQGIKLLVMNPQYFSQNDAVAYIGGHVWFAKTEGVQTVDLGDPALAQSMLLDEESMMMDITGVEVFDTSLGIFHSLSWVQEGDTFVKVGAAYWFDPQTGAVGDILPVPIPDGGAVRVGDIVYVGSYENSAPGIYPVDPATNTLAGNILSSSLPPYSMVYIADDTQTFIAEEKAVPESLALDAPYPNPFNPATTISFRVADAGMARVDVFTIAGQKVATLLDGYLPAGEHTVMWHAGEISNGVYFIRVRHNNTVRTAKVMLVK